MNNNILSITKISVVNLFTRTVQKVSFFLFPFFLFGCTQQEIENEIHSQETETSFLIGLQTPLSKQYLECFYSDESIAENGAMGRNARAGKFMDASSQMGAADIMYRGISENDKEMISRAITALEYPFKFQDEKGYFLNGHGVSPLQATTADAFFLSAIGRAALTLEQSQYTTEFARIEALKPKISLALDWLASSEAKGALQRQDIGAPNRLIIDAVAYSMNGVFLERSDLQEIGAEFIELALNRQRADGVFPEKGGSDSSYQAVSILYLDYYWIWSTNKKLKERIFTALEKATEWEKSRIDSETGEVSKEGNTRTGLCQEKNKEGRCKDINYPQVVASLLYWSQIAKDQEAEELALKVLEYSKSIRRR